MRAAGWVRAAGEELRGGWVGERLRAKVLAGAEYVRAAGQRLNVGGSAPAH